MSTTMLQENILDHYKHPRNFGTLDHAQHAHAANPLCGDELDFYLDIDGQGQVRQVRFTGRGCTITMTSASMLSEQLPGKSVQEVKNLKNDDVLKLLGVPVNPARLKCATLALETVQQAVGHHTA